MPPYAPRCWPQRRDLKPLSKSANWFLNTEKNFLTKNQQIDKSHHLLIRTTAKHSSVKIVGTQMASNERRNPSNRSQTNNIRSKILAALRERSQVISAEAIIIFSRKNLQLSFARSKITHSSSRWGKLLFIWNRLANIRG